MASSNKRKIVNVLNGDIDHQQQNTKRRKLQQTDGSDSKPCTTDYTTFDIEAESQSIIMALIADVADTAISPQSLDSKLKSNHVNPTLSASANDVAEPSTASATTTTTAPILGPYPFSEHNFESAKMVLRATSVFADTTGDHSRWMDGGNFIKGIWWSPNGQHLLSSSNDRRLRMFNPLHDVYYGNGGDSDGDSSGKEMNVSVEYGHREPVYDVSWYPLFRSNDPSSNVFLSCSRDSPIFLFDSWQNCKRSSYCYRFADSAMSPYSVSFDSSGQYLYGGFKRYVIQFATSRSGEHHCRRIETVNRNKMGQKSIISVLRFLPQNDFVFAAGCYDGMTQLFDVRCRSALCAMKCVQSRNGGVTDLAFSPCTNYLLCGQRNGPDIDCWDLRALKQRCYVDGVFANGLDSERFHDQNTRVLKDNDKAHSLCAKYTRNVTNHQRVQFDIDRYSGSWIVSGNQRNGMGVDGGDTAHCTVYDVNCSEFEVAPRFKLNHDVAPNGERIPNVTSVSAARLCPKYPFMATTIGQRTLTKRKKKESGGNDQDCFENGNAKGPNTVNEDADNSDSIEWTSSDECDDDIVNVNDICLWDLSPKPIDTF